MWRYCLMESCPYRERTGYYYYSSFGNVHVECPPQTDMKEQGITSASTKNLLIMLWRQKSTLWCTHINHLNTTSWFHRSKRLKHDDTPPPPDHMETRFEPSLTVHKYGWFILAACFLQHVQGFVQIGICWYTSLLQDISSICAYLRAMTQKYNKLSVPTVDSFTG